MLQFNVKVAMNFYTQFQHHCSFTCVLFRVNSKKYYLDRKKENTFNAWLTLKYASSDTNYSHPCDAAIGLLILRTYNFHAKLIQNINKMYYSEGSAAE
jgi:hypothetical protein